MPDLQNQPARAYDLPPQSRYLVITMGTHKVNGRRVTRGDVVMASNSHIAENIIKSRLVMVTVHYMLAVPSEVINKWADDINNMTPQMIQENLNKIGEVS